VASFRKKAHAEGDAKRYADRGLSARVFKVNLEKMGLWHRVCIGKFDNRSQAKARAEAWKKSGLLKGPFMYVVH
jgi:cell division protein FtsN